MLPGAILEKLEHAMDHDDYDELRKGVIKALGRAGGMPVGGGAHAPAMPLGWVTRLLPSMIRGLSRRHAGIRRR